MPRTAKGPYLYQRPDTKIYIIRGTGRGEYSTSTRDHDEAQAILNAYVARLNQPSKTSNADELLVADVLSFYGEGKAPKAKDKERIYYAMKALLPYWGARYVSEINEKTCEEYADSRIRVTKVDPITKTPIASEPISDGTIIKELGTLRAALKFCAIQKYLAEAPLFILRQNRNQMTNG